MPQRSACSLRPALPLRARTALAAALLTCLVGLPLAGGAQEKGGLPDIGSSAGEMLTPARQAEYGSMVLRELRNYGYVLDDPLLEQWINNVGRKLGANSDQPRQPFTFFLLKDRQINAFATLGGYVATNAGLVLTADREDEVAAVLSHEIAHVTQQHVLRGAERAKRDQIPIMLGMLAAIIAAQQAGGNSSGDATMAAVTSGFGLMQQRQIDYTRANESEADRIGIRTLYRSGYDTQAMAGFFERMSVATRANVGSGAAPDYLQSHPVTTTRISEAHDRARQLDAAPPVFQAGFTRRDNPMLPASLQLTDDALGNGRGGTGQFDYAKERLRVLSANTADAAIREYNDLRRASADGLGPAQEYGYALAKLINGNVGESLAQLDGLSKAAPDNLWVALALAEAESRAGKAVAANARMDGLLQRLPNNKVVALTYAKILNEQGGAEAGRRSRDVLRPVLVTAADDPVFQQAYARANELAGDMVRAGEAYAEAAFLNGRAEQALIQLNLLLKREDLDYYAHARIDGRIAAITPIVLEMRRAGEHDPELSRN